MLEAEDRRPPVIMRVFQKKAALLGGVDEAIAILRLCSGRRPPDGRWEDGWDALTVRALHEGDEIAPPDPVMHIEGDHSLYAHLETVYLGCVARRTLVMRNVHEVVEAGGRQADPLPRARPLPRPDRRRLGGPRGRSYRSIDRRAGIVGGTGAG